MKKILILCLLAMLSIPLIYAQCTDTDGGVTCNNQFYNDYCETTSTGEQYANTRICKNVTYQDCALLVGVNRVLCPNGCQNGACIQPNMTCTDSDGGQDIYVQGKVTDSLGNVLTDYCIDSQRIFEYYCLSDGSRSGTTLGCTNGCQNGACLLTISKPDLVISSIVFQPQKSVYNKKEPINMTITMKNIGNADSGKFAIKIRNTVNNWDMGGGAGYTLKAGQSYEEMSGYSSVYWAVEGNNKIEVVIDSDKQIDESDENNNVFSQSLQVTTSMCTDSDGGLNYYVRGSTTLSDGSGLNDDCRKDYIGSVLTLTGELLEAMCLSDGSDDKYITYKCPYGCKDGACIQQQTSNCTDSDGGKDYYTKGECKDSGGAYGADTCIDATKLTEMYCTSNPDCFSETYTCLNGCKDGACVQQSTNCTDSDGGKNYYVKGTTTGPKGEGVITQTDSCLDSNILGEWFCWESDGHVEGEKYTCTIGCKDGACISECGDGICGEGEDVACPEDCYAICNYDGVCDPEEDGNCVDCLVIEVCNKDGVCDLKQEENSENCPEDCYCGDDICDPSESSKNCPDDCNYCTPEWECRIEPTTCPAEGIQNKICTDIKCGTEEKRVESMECIPGTCSGCLSFDICYPVTTRMLRYEIPSYCDVTKTFKKQKELGDSCQNNYECKTNECSDGECISIKGELEETQSLLKRILDWISNIF